jgi:hypothetical protein
VKFSIPVLLGLLALDVSAAEVVEDLRLTAEGAHYDDNTLFSVPESILPAPSRSAEQNLELNWQHTGFNTTATLRNRMTENRKPEQDAFFNELYLDTHMAGQDVSIGRKITSWGVGFGYRPLDVIQQEDRRALYRNTLRGVNLLAWELFFDTAALSILWTNPGNGDNADHPESTAIKFYRTNGNSDWHALARYSKPTGTQAGIGISMVFGDSFEWHASVLWQRYDTSPINRLTLLQTPPAPPLSQNNPFIEHNRNNAIKALAGASWTQLSGWTLLAEVWYDKSAYSDREWRSLTTLTEAQRVLLTATNRSAATISANIAYNQQAFTQDNLHQWNTLLRLSRSRNGMEPSLELLYTPKDQGLVTTARITHTFNRQKIEAGLRIFGGADESAWNRLPLDQVVYISW